MQSHTKPHFAKHRISNAVFDASEIKKEELPLIVRESKKYAEKHLMWKQKQDPKYIQREYIAYFDDKKDAQKMNLKRSKTINNVDTFKRNMFQKHFLMDK